MDVRRETVIPFVLIVALGLLIYGQTLSFDFTFCDDYKNIVEEQALIEDFSRLPQAFTKSFGSLYRPALRISYIVDHAIGGIEPWIYHGSNLIFHLAASCLVFVTLSRLLGRRTALFFSLLFTAHPLLVEAVAWIPGRNDSLVTIFVLLAFLSISRNYAVHFLCFVLALLSKEIAALFPLLGLYHLRVVKREKARTFILISGWAVIGLAWFLLRSAALERSSSPDLTGLTAFIKNLPALPALIGKLVFPYHLSGLATFEMVSISAGIASVIVLVFLAFRYKGSRIAGLGAVWFLLFLLPTLFFRVHHADDHFDYMEHRAYLPAVGFLLFLGGLGLRFEKKKAAVVFTLVLAVFSVRAFMYVREYRDSRTFWNAAIAHDGARSNFYSVLGKFEFDEKEFKEAEALFRKAVSLSKLNDPDNYYNLAVILKEQGRIEESIEFGRRAIELDPRNPFYPFFLGKVYAKRGENDLAEQHLKRAVELHPGYIDSLMQLIGVYLNRKEVDRAIETCHAILSIDADHFLAHDFLGILYAGQGRMEEAAKHWRRTLELNPGHLPSYEKLIRYHLEANRMELARRYGEELLRRGGKLSAEDRRRLGL
jgi:tetratricopeptide (TPR) repeat protein